MYMHQLQRTQIYLPADLRREIDRQRALNGESLAEYTRKALGNRVQKGKKERANLKKLADEVVGAARGTRTKEGVLKWEKEIRRDRKLADQQWINRWDEAVKKNVSA
ncbi:hypothetical protein A3B42_03270 [Candidatus Daviesbacteria bacterium RIFCSPLOWO2_01_FULL_38_10]|uniref:Ribbon-helix-helix protein CopG domain-containing protein n=1 Tax=Candidatus Daviesbacteria bacterium GW2011_GWF2_38_6 TaxID=1618432 RepID=A0A0G0KJ34_9BACT|nr:MAG: hypothetical protein US99_C0011G0002 [Candidatus Daviesbacteria bacterium GW2011_GWF2_38_6]OGE37071.1 MAG: hypothetical protein A3B42_03270 [Candidatus Daviesbacteria bacterium RIFCSPLOWO2_01_FULL_38_10]OGE45168.1 MAG: hypothetical protein A3E67_03110 [Candidatus Daviesbacteria bacterium RIFCSPHIGHO2_12_FULL_38_25]